MNFGDPNTDLVVDIGAASLPADPSLVTKTLVTALDPAQEILLGLVEFTINSELGKVWNKIAPSLSDKFKDGYVIQHKLAFNPQNYLTKANVLKFPLLAGWRDKATHKEFSLVDRQVQTTWNLTYIIGETTLEDQGKLNGLLNGVSNAIKMALDTGRYPGYLDGYQCLVDPDFGAKFWGVYTTSTAYNSWQITSGDSLIVYPAIMFVFDTAENVDYPADVYPDASGAIIHANIPDGYLGTLLDVAVADTEHLPNNI